MSGFAGIFAIGLIKSKLFLLVNLDKERSTRLIVHKSKEDYMTTTNRENSGAARLATLLILAVSLLCGIRSAEAQWPEAIILVDKKKREKVKIELENLAKKTVPELIKISILTGGIPLIGAIKTREGKELERRTFELSGHWHSLLDNRRPVIPRRFV
jgi:hypothetical protein